MAQVASVLSLGNSSYFRYRSNYGYHFSIGFYYFLLAQNLQAVTAIRHNGSSLQKHAPLHTYPSTPTLQHLARFDTWIRLYVASAPGGWSLLHLIDLLVLASLVEDKYTLVKRRYKQPHVLLYNLKRKCILWQPSPLLLFPHQRLLSLNKIVSILLWSQPLAQSCQHKYQ